MTQKLSSFEALRAYCSDQQAAYNCGEARPELRVAMATCAIATGAQETYEALEKALAAEDLPEVQLKKTGCIGYCFAEPTVEVCMPGEPPVLYGPVDEALAFDIVRKHIKGGQLLSEAQVPICHENVKEGF